MFGGKATQNFSLVSHCSTAPPAGTCLLDGRDASLDSILGVQWRGHEGFGGALPPTFARILLQISSNSMRKYIWEEVVANL